MTKVISKTAGKIERLILSSSKSLECSNGISNISDSTYLTISKVIDDKVIDRIELRISDHELPATYANNHTSDYEIGDNNNYASATFSEWFLIVAKILDRFSINYPPTLKRLLTIKMNNENKIKIEREEFKAKLKAIKIVKEENATEIFNANREKILEQVYKLNNLSGKKRRSLRSKFNQTYGANSFEIREIATTILDAAI